MSDKPMTREEVLAAREAYVQGYLDGSDGNLLVAQRRASEEYPLPPITRPREFRAGGRT